MAGVEIGDVVCKMAKIFEPNESALDLLIEGHTFWSWLKTSTDPMEQLYPRDLFKAFDLAAHSWLGKIEEFGTSRNTARAHHGLENFYLPQIHSLPACELRLFKPDHPPTRRTRQGVGDGVGR
ncbi:hypothetical protein CHELA40_10703 [Chelatococcus asaccharovorans]|nr:hypothetical protein CHELA40_10703 [Chelatococcus asaccharovorans]CAH1686231.1 hypothetical protein CHELA17_64903 [Chelatococcus asaccharovorans]